ncbi:hypothetical protein KQ945_08925 [Bacillus subtilis subsp. subtilis]|nr:hypothetical protein [Bacillus subtilis subsp. subtilis]
MTSSPLRILGIGLATLLAAVIVCCLATQVGSNAMMLLLDRGNVIPEESSIFWFDPYVVNSGSSNYWLYARDRTYYYHFTYLADAPYVYLPVDNTCPGFERGNVRTWCNVRVGGRH